MLLLFSIQTQELRLLPLITVLESRLKDYRNAKQGVRVMNRTESSRLINLLAYLKKRNPNGLRFIFVKTAIMPSFDMVSKVDLQTLDNAINVVNKEITNRFDFKGS